MWVSLGQNIKINNSVLFDIIEKGKKYIKQGQQPPKGVVIHQGKRGGRYYLIEDKHLKINDQHHELIRGVGVTRDQHETVKQKLVDQGAQSVEFIPQPEYGKRADNKPRYNIYVNWGDKTQQKIEDKKKADKEKYGKHYDTESLDWNKQGTKQTAPYLKSVGNRYVKAGTFRIDEMYHGAKLYFIGPDGKAQHLGNAFSQHFISGTDKVDEGRSRQHNVEVLKDIALSINHHGPSQLNSYLSNTRRLDAEKEAEKDKPKKEYVPKNEWKNLQIMLNDIRTGKVDPARTRTETQLQEEKGELGIKDFVVKKLAQMFNTHSPEDIANAAAISLRKFEETNSLFDTINAGKYRLANLKPTKREPIQAPKVTLPPKPEPKPVPEVAKPVEPTGPKFKLISQFTTRDAADRASSIETKDGYETSIKEKKVGKATVFNLYRRKAQTKPQVSVPHGDEPGNNGWLRKVTKYNPEHNLNTGEFLNHDTIENGQKKFTLDDGIYQAGTGPKYHNAPPKYYHVSNGQVRDIDTREYQQHLRKLPYIDPAEAISHMYDTTTKPIREQVFNPQRYAKDKTYRKQVDAQITSKNEPSVSVPEQGKRYNSGYYKAVTITDSGKPYTYKIKTRDTEDGQDTKSIYQIKQEAVEKHNATKSTTKYYEGSISGKSLQDKEAIDSSRYQTDPDYKNQVNQNQKTRQESWYDKQVPDRHHNFVPGNREGEMVWTAKDGTYKIKPTADRGTKLTYSRPGSQNEHDVKSSNNIDELKQAATQHYTNVHFKNTRGIDYETLDKKLNSLSKKQNKQISARSIPV